MSATIKYKGETLATINTTATKTIKTQGKYCEADIIVENVDSGGAPTNPYIEYTFDSNNKMTQVDLHDYPNKIPSYICQSESNLTTINLYGASRNIITIGNYAFSYCPSLTQFDFPDTVTTIGPAAFYNSGLTSLTFPSNVSNIGNSAFYGCTGLTTVTVPGSFTMGSSIFEGCTGLEEATVMRQPTGTSSPMGNYMFRNCTSLKNIEFNRTSMANYFAYGCTNLEKVWIRGDVANIAASSASNAPFYNTNANLVIYCEASSKKSGWGNYFNYYSSSGRLTVVYNQSTRPW